jgi:hypothetical protein
MYSTWSSSLAQIPVSLWLGLWVSCTTRALNLTQYCSTWHSVVNRNAVLNNLSRIMNSTRSTLDATLSPCAVGKLHHGGRLTCSNQLGLEDYELNQCTFDSVCSLIPPFFISTILATERQSRLVCTLHSVGKQLTIQRHLGYPCRSPLLTVCVLAPWEHKASCVTFCITVRH